MDTSGALPALCQFERPLPSTSSSHSVKGGRCKGTFLELIPLLPNLETHQGWSRLPRANTSHPKEVGDPTQGPHDTSQALHSQSPSS